METIRVSDRWPKSIHVVCPRGKDLRRALAEAASDSLDFIVIATGAIKADDIQDMKAYLGECVRVLRDGGLLFVQGRPEYLPELGVFLDGKLNFKYWIAIESATQRRAAGLPSAHAAILLFSKGNRRFNIKRIRFPHEHCAFCGRTLRDWGGKSHLMHPEGYAASDVWTDLPREDNYTQISEPVLDAIMRMLDFHDPAESRIGSPGYTAVTEPAPSARGLIGPREGITSHRPPRFVANRPVRHGGAPLHSKHTIELGADLTNVVHCGDAVEVLKRYPDNSIDLAFADPPYNLNKGYSIYKDGWDEREYVDWCNAWLGEYVRVLKPTGSLYVLNLPRWSMHHAVFLNERLYFQNWIVWDALSEPRGKLMPAHYGLLFYTKHPTDFTFNYDEVSRLDARCYCLRSTCIAKRKLSGADDKEPLTDIWWDIHRIKHPRDRDYHPCQLPDALMERIIRLSSNEGDIVLDALCGAGTTPVAAAKLGRRYAAIDLDESYVGITREKISHVERLGYVQRSSTRRPRQACTKKQLQLELRDLAVELGRLPTPEDVRAMTPYDPEDFLKVFPTWGKALKAAKLEALG